MPRFLAASLASLLMSVAPATPLPKEAARPPLYFPVTVGAKWVYKTDDGREEAVAVTAVERKGDEYVVERSGVEGNSRPYLDVVVSTRGLRQGTDGLLKTPFQPDDKWDDTGGTRTIHGPEPVTVPAGTFTAVRVEAKRADGGPTTVDWYVAGMGGVKRVKRAADGTVTVVRDLMSFTPGKE